MEFFTFIDRFGSILAVVGASITIWLTYKSSRDQHAKGEVWRAITDKKLNDISDCATEMKTDIKAINFNAQQMSERISKVESRQDFQGRQIDKAWEKIDELSEVR